MQVWGPLHLYKWLWFSLCVIISLTFWVFFKVLYDTSGFLEKNRDPLPSVSIQLLSSCSCQLLQLFASKVVKQFQKPENTSCQINSLDPPKPSTGIKFKVHMLAQLWASSSCMSRSDAKIMNLIWLRCDLRDDFGWSYLFTFNFQIFFEIGILRHSRLSFSTFKNYHAFL